MDKFVVYENIEDNILYSLVYEVEDGEITITKCSDKNATEVVIPSEIDGFPVTSIGEGAFRDCKKLKKVTIEKGIVKIEREAFYCCLELTSIAIPNSVIEINDKAFDWCPKLRDIEFPTPNKKCRINCTAGLPLRHCVDRNWRV